MIRISRSRLVFKHFLTELYPLDLVKFHLFAVYLQFPFIFLAIPVARTKRNCHRIKRSNYVLVMIEQFLIELKDYFLNAFELKYLGYKSTIR